MNHLTEVFKNREDRQDKEEHVMLVCQIQGLTKGLITARRKKHTQTKKQEAKESQTYAEQQTWGRLSVYDPPLPPRPLLHTHRHTVDHTLPSRSV